MSAAPPIIRQLLADVAAAGGWITAEGGRLFIEPASRIGPELWERLRTHRRQLLALLDPTAGPSGELLRLPVAVRALELLEDFGPLEVLTGRYAEWGSVWRGSARYWNRAQAAAILKAEWRRGSRPDARALQAAWYRRVDEATAEGRSMRMAEAEALAELQRLTLAIWGGRGSLGVGIPPRPPPPDPLPAGQSAPTISHDRGRKNPAGESESKIVGVGHRGL